MNEDMTKLRVAICGNLPKLTKWLTQFGNGIECCMFKDSRELRDRLMNMQATPIDVALMESNCDIGLRPLYFRAAREDCQVLVVTDTSQDLVGAELDKIYRKKRQEQEQVGRRKERALTVALHPEAELIEQDGTPGLRLGNRERYAKDPIQAWILRLLVNGEKSLDDLETQILSELMPEVNRFCSELWRDWEDEEGPSILDEIKRWFSENGLEPDSTLVGMLMGDFILYFTDFLAREAVG